MFGRILIPTDGSSCSLLAVAQGLQLARKIGAEVTFLYAVEQPLMPYVDGALYPTDYYDDLKRSAEMTLAEVAERASTEGVPAHTVLAERKRPVAAILDASQEFELVIIATHGRRGFDRYVFGSVTEAVIRRIRIPCLIVHCHEEAEEPEELKKETLTAKAQEESQAGAPS